MCVRELPRGQGRERQADAALRGQYLSLPEGSLGARDGFTHAADGFPARTGRERSHGGQARPAQPCRCPRGRPCQLRLPCCHRACLLMCLMGVSMSSLL